MTTNTSAISHNNLALVRGSNPNKTTTVPVETLKVEAKVTNNKMVLRAYYYSIKPGVVVEAKMRVGFIPQDWFKLNVAEIKGLKVYTLEDYLQKNPKENPLHPNLHKAIMAIPKEDNNFVTRWITTSEGVQYQSLHLLTGQKGEGETIEESIQQVWENMPANKLGDIPA